VVIISNPPVTRQNFGGFHLRNTPASQAATPSRTTRIIRAYNFHPQRTSGRPNTLCNARFHLRPKNWRGLRRFPNNGCFVSSGGWTNWKQAHVTKPWAASNISSKFQPLFRSDRQQHSTGHCPVPFPRTPTYNKLIPYFNNGAFSFIITADIMGHRNRFLPRDIQHIHFFGTSTR